MSYIGRAAAIAVGERATPSEGLQRAIQRAGSGGTVTLSPGVYTLDRAVVIDGIDGLSIIGGPGAKVVYPSASQVPAQGWADSSVMSGAFAVRNSSSVSFEGLQFVGSSETDRSQNTGSAIHLRGSSDCHVVRCTSTAGGGLITQDSEAGDLGTRVVDCTIVDPIRSLRVRSAAVVSRCRFVWSDDVSMDRVGPVGPTHGIYLFAGSSEVLVDSCTFTNCRKFGVKASGTSKPVRGITVSRCSFIDCGGGVEFGGDGAAAGHSGVLVDGCTFIDCGTNRAGWSESVAVRALGSDGCAISGNRFLYTRTTVQNAAAVRAISASTYDGQSERLTGLSISGNRISTRLALASPGLLMPYAISVRDADDITISGNSILNSASWAVLAADVDGLDVSGNHARSVFVAADVSGSPLANVSDNRISSALAADQHIRISSSPGAVQSNNQGADVLVS